MKTEKKEKNTGPTAWARAIEVRGRLVLGLVVGAAACRRCWAGTQAFVLGWSRPWPAWAP